MPKRNTRRRAKRTLTTLSGPQKPYEPETIYGQLCSAIQHRRFIPIIGETVRIEHIFSVDSDNEIGVDEADGLDEMEDLEEADYIREVDELLNLNIMEQLALRWAESIGYPFGDKSRMARVAQYRAFTTQHPTNAKENYLRFLKNTLLDVAESIAQSEEDREGIEFIRELRRDQMVSFTDTVRALDYPRFRNPDDDPLRILARLPIRIYVTTGYHTFIEQALERENKKPQTRLCLWNRQEETVEPEHRLDPDYEPSAASPVVYHLLGLEQYPASLVLTEDDYLDFLKELARDEPKDNKSGRDSGRRIIPPYLEAELEHSSLLLLGYRLQDWDFRVLFRGLLDAHNQWGSQGGVSVAIQVDPDSQEGGIFHGQESVTKPNNQDAENTEIVNDENAEVDKKVEMERHKGNIKGYLSRYFQQSMFQVEWSESDEFILELWKEYQRFTGVNGS